jgi:hypothetical protein
MAVYVDDGAGLPAEARNGWIWREQDAHPEIRLEPAALLQRRVAFARLRADGYSVRTAGIMLCLGERVPQRYETRRLASAAAYKAMCSRRPGRVAEAGS